ncbi:hypothetical protein CSC2_12600 [Clostridium zeae]|uniref:Uncharacterized protein n=1 Tax=Clostridium zeae TaxID=2759022 RepID=A0ABQ1E7S0_9CLOT|nr:hypothetical protein [Clostridium zeae]GFZ30734.1 hypothetical protein CSC2_12600 [Clostridium zeae]
MIITLDKAKKLIPVDDTSKDFELEEKLKALEIMVRNLTNNKFLDNKIRSYKKLNFQVEGNVISGNNFLKLGFRQGDSIDIDECLLNKGIFTISEVTDTYIKVDEAILEEQGSALVTKIAYPYDLVQGVIKLIQYDLKMADKLGIKQESISRYSVTYYDVNSTESIEGYPAVLMKFLNKYKKLRWA